MNAIRYIFVICFMLLCAKEAYALVPIVPYPKSVEEGADRADIRYGNFALESEFDLAETQAVWDEICAKADINSSATLGVFLHHKDSISGYTLDWRGNEVSISAPNGDLAFAALQTLKQLIRADYPKNIIILDSPDMNRRAFMDDVSRGAVPTLAQMKRQICLLSELKYNAYTLYIEDVARTHSHPDVAPDDGYITMEDLDEICEYAKSYHMEVIGCLQSFGHSEHLLSQPAYRELGATASMLDTESPKTRKYLKAVISELALHSSSEYFNVCCDETFDLESVPNGEEIYASHILWLSELLKGQGKKVLVFGDMFMKFPSILERMPANVIPVTWNYDAQSSYRAWIEPFKGREFWVAPGIHCSSRLIPDVITAEGNRQFVIEGFDSGATGTLVCTWDESTYHSVENLTYGISKFAETMWNTSAGCPSQDFDDRYEVVRFGCENGITSVYNDMMKLGKLPMYAGMSDRIFYSRALPGQGMPLIIDSNQLMAADSILNCIGERIDRAICLCRSNKSEIEVWKYSYDCYRYMTDIRLGMLHFESVGLDDFCNLMETEINDLQDSFEKWWKRENQMHSFQAAISDFDEKRAGIDRLRHEDIQSLQVYDRQNPYMCYWLTTLTAAGDNVPANTQPTPGAMTMLERSGTFARWSKSESTDGLFMNCKVFYPDADLGTTMWAYAWINAPQETDVVFLIGYVGRLEMYIDGESVYRGGLEGSYAADSHTAKVRLMEGRNHVLIKLDKQFPECLMSVYMDGPQAYNNKYRYTITNVN